MGSVLKRVWIKGIGMMAWAACAGWESDAALAEPALPAPAEVEFSNEFLQFKGGAPVDVSRFSKGNLLMPGTYRSDLYINGRWLGRPEIVLRNIGDDAGASTCV